MAALAISLGVAELTAYAGLKILGQGTPTTNPPHTEYLPWGAWGKPNTTSQLSSRCFDVTYRFNSVGTRDRERSLTGDGRWLFIGDSFVEGYGLEEDQRLTNVLEKATGHEILNFSSSGNFGPLQYLLVYEQLARNYQHKGLIIGLLPDNDFTDNNVDWWAQNKGAVHWLRHRPYFLLTADGSDFTVQYGVKGRSVPRADLDTEPVLPNSDNADAGKLGAVAATFIDAGEALSRSSIVRLANRVYKQMSATDAEGDGDPAVGYFLTDRAAAHAVELAFGRLSRLAADKQRYVVVFPRKSDLERQRSSGQRSGPVLAELLDHLAGQGWNVIDLSADPQLLALPDVSLPCNEHWNAEANAVAATYLADKIDW
jgi:hypothetical protein